MIETIVADGVAAGEFAHVDPAQTALAIAALIDGLNVQTALGDPDVSADRLTETVLACAERLLGALAAGHRSEPRLALKARPGGAVTAPASRVANTQQIGTCLTIGAGIG